MYNTKILSLLLLAAWGLLSLLSLAGCEIEETPPPKSGSIRVTLTDSLGVSLTGARIYLDGRETARRAPAILSGIPVGRHEVGIFKPGFADTTVAVDVFDNQVSEAALVTFLEEGGTIAFLGADEDVELIINNVRVTQDQGDGIAFFDSLGTGTFRVSAYRPGHATAFPAEWTVDLEPGSYVELSPTFIPLETGYESGDLAPVFDLPSDWDSTRYRLQDYRGKVVLVSFFFYNCTGCVEEMPYIAAVYNDPRYNGKVQFFGIDYIDTYGTFANFRADHPTLDVRFPLLHDRMLTLRDAYNVTTMPANYIIDQTGRISSLQGALSETGLRQLVDQLLDQQSRPSFNFVMWDTLITYTDPNHSLEFYGQIENLSPSPQRFVLDLTPVDFEGDTARQTSICVASDCFAPRSGSITWTYTLPPQRTDTLRYSLYNVVSDWSLGFPMPQDSALVGNYTFDVSVASADNPTGRTTYRLRGVRAGSSFAVSPFDKNPINHQNRR